jgi:hypothetical protein
VVRTRIEPFQIGERSARFVDLCLAEVIITGVYSPEQTPAVTLLSFFERIFRRM